MTLASKVVVVTGSTRGIGRAIAESAAARGATVVLNGRTAEAVEHAVAELAATGAHVSGLAGNVGHYEEVVALRDHALAAHGRVDAWVSNAGVSNGYRFLEDESAEEIRDLITINVLGQLYSAKAVLPLFAEKGGYLMNVCGRGWKGDATAFTTAYGASKAASASLTRSLAAEYRDYPNISVNGFVPGMVDTGFYGDDMPVSPRLEATKHQVNLALEAFGTPLDAVGERCAELIAEEPGRTSGRIYPMLRAGQLVRGGAKMAWWGMTGRMKPRE
jgi:NAD(P)-dependent dehydrogenase (short-subunit alcohol dehydrogenase family)